MKRNPNRATGTNSQTKQENARRRLWPRHLTQRGLLGDKWKEIQIEPQAQTRKTKARKCKETCLAKASDAKRPTRRQMKRNPNRATGTNSQTKQENARGRLWPRHLTQRGLLGDKWKRNPHRATGTNSQTKQEKCKEDVVWPRHLTQRGLLGDEWKEIHIEPQAQTRKQSKKMQGGRLWPRHLRQCKEMSVELQIQPSEMQIRLRSLPAPGLFLFQRNKSEREC